ncbi:MAG: pyruvate, phosphate dikinase [Candidatus Thermoplasmatota archaeon]|nr:pyruvate, phosphate dikinase [Candidatus Thermoplasmatota archaeon]
MAKYAYYFGKDGAEGRRDMKDLLGGKGAGLAEMTNIGLPVPPGFTITTEVCVYYYRNKEYPEGVKEQVEAALQKLENEMGLNFGDRDRPLLVSVRSGARTSMPGMMDTILNVGLNDESVNGLSKMTGNERFAWDSYRRLIQMFGDVVLGIKHAKFEEILQSVKEKKGLKYDYELSTEDLKEIVKQYKELVKKETGRDFPQDPREQLWLAIDAVFKSWDNQRAITYRKINSIPDDWGTAANVQTMVFGNMGENSATGVGFTRNPATGEKNMYGEFLSNAQGEDVVAGIRTPLPISELERTIPDAYRQLLNVAETLEKHYKDVQDFEFTIQQGKLYMLQTRTGKRTALAAVKIAVDMVKEGLISEEEAVIRIEPEQVETLLHPMIDPEAEVNEIARGLPASPGAVTGKVIFDSAEAAEIKEKDPKAKMILVRAETSPEDIAGMDACEGILTQHGGMTSHAAVVSRAMGKVCIVGCEAISVAREEFRAKDVVVKKGDVITLDGTNGRVILGDAPKVEASVMGEFAELLSYADKFRRLGVRANADTPEQARVAHNFGAEGVGLCRTEHMFFGGERIKAMREMILSDTEDQRKKALSKLLPMQRSDFIEFFREMVGKPVIIRTIDPPLHEFLPKTEEQIKDLAEAMGISEKELKRKAESLHEINPMLGHRGCRLGITYPEITEMQTRAIFEAACQVKREGKEVIAEVMIPVVNDVREFINQKEIVDRVAKKVMQEQETDIRYKVGIMVELPRACVTADRIAKHAEFFSFGTNDLTQTTFGFSRDDVGKFVPEFIKRGILDFDPFQRLDEEGVGELMKIAVTKGKSANAEIELGICGEHGGDPSSIDFCHRAGLDYVSCSAYRVPVARLAAAHASLRKR